MADSDILDRVSAAEAADRLGLSVETIKRKLKSGKLDGRRDNAGKWWVNLPRRAMAESESAIAVPRYDTAMAMPCHSEPAGAVPIAVYQDVLAELTSVRADHRATVALLVERIDAAECRAERAEEKLIAVLDRLSRPWWRFWR